MVLARRTWAAAVTLLKATTRSWGFAKAAACSPSVILPEELFSTEPWQPEKHIRTTEKFSRSGLQGNTANRCDLFIWTLLHRKFLGRNTYFWGNHLLYVFLKMFWFHLFCSCIISTDTNKYREVFKICFEYKRKGWVTNTNSLFCIPNSKSYPFPLMHMKKKQTKMPNCFYSQF